MSGSFTPYHNYISDVGRNPRLDVEFIKLRITKIYVVSRPVVPE